MSAAREIKRRDFLKVGAALGGGLVISTFIPEWAQATGAPLPASAAFAPNAFVRIGTDEIVTVIANHSEMGQGVYTSLPMLLAEELEPEWSKVRVESAPVAAVYNHTVFQAQITGGSTTTTSEYDRFRKMGAMARVMLIRSGSRFGSGGANGFSILSWPSHEPDCCNKATIDLASSQSAVPVCLRLNFPPSVPDT